MPAMIHPHSATFANNLWLPLVQIQSPFPLAVLSRSFSVARSLSPADPPTAAKSASGSGNMPHLAVVTLEQTRARGDEDSQVESIKDKSG
ncbi:hypothetical protein V8C44DRAFT_334355 [Trichoderma aethiopicum]